MNSNKAQGLAFDKKVNVIIYCGFRVCQWCFLWRVTRSEMCGVSVASWENNANQQHRVWDPATSRSTVLPKKSVPHCVICIITSPCLSFPHLPAWNIENDVIHNNSSFFQLVIKKLSNHKLLPTAILNNLTKQDLPATKNSTVTS